MENCIFCKIIKGEIAAEKVYEDEVSFAFLDVHPRTPGHTMVIPKTHASNMLELSPEMVGPFFISAQKVLGMVNRALHPQGFSLGLNHNRVAGQEVDHMHFHIMPRYENDGGHSIQSVVSNPPTEDIKTIGEKIRAAK